VRAKRVALGTAAGALIASALAFTPAIGQSGDNRAAKPRVSLSARGGLGSFTPATTDARLSALMARSGVVSNGFRFTPATTGVRLNRQVTVAVRADMMTGASRNNERAALVAPVSTTSIAPVAYNLGVAVGWKRFAFSGDVARVDLGTLGGREAMDVGVSYTTKRLTTRVAVGADHATPDTPRALTQADGVSVAMSGSYSIAKNLDLTAGVQYRRAERDQRLTPVDNSRRDSQAVFIGTAFKF
jgi:Gram-negative porin